MPESCPSSPPAPPAAPPQPQIVVVPVAVVPVPVPVFVPVPAASAPKAGGTAPEPPDVGPEPSPLPAPFVPAKPPGALSRFWRRFGGTGFVVSSLFHFALLTFALFWIVAEWAAPVEAEAMFVSGAGGASAGTARENFSRRTFRRPPPAESPKIVSRSRESKLALPEMPKLDAPRNLSLPAGKSGGNAGGADASGLAGFGGGLGAGTGVGIGGGKNHLGKFRTLLGAKIRAQRIAVFLDCSGSMRSFLPAVKEEIYEKFPDADVFAFSGTGIEVHDGEILGGKNMKAKTLAGIRRKRADDETDVSRLSGAAKTLHRRYADHFAAGTAGAWLDVFLRERYDALVVFSDFRDGIRQRRGGKTVFADSSYSPAPDARDARERRWEADWLAACSRAGAPRLYLFSVRAQPQDFLRRCVSASGGEIVVLDLKKKKSRD